MNKFYFAKATKNRYFYSLLCVTIVALSSSITTSSEPSKPSFFKTAFSYGKLIAIGGITGGIMAALISDKSTNEKIATPFISGIIGLGLGGLITAATIPPVNRKLMPQDFFGNSNISLNRSAIEHIHLHGVRSGMATLLAPLLTCGTITYSVLSK